MNYGGYFFEEVIDGYRTLSVEGREMMSVDIQTDDLAIGSVITSQSLPSRVLTVKYKLEVKDAEMILVEHRRLMSYLYKEKEVPIVFNDELDMTYYGRFTSSDTPPGDTYSYIGTFQILCESPFKYSKVHSTKKEVTQRIPYKVNPVKFVVKPIAGGNLTITDGEQTIVVENLVLNGASELELVYLDNSIRLLLNGINITKKLALTTAPESFYVYQGQKISCNNGTIEMYYREVWL